MYNPNNYSQWDNFELTEISNSVLAQASGYYFHLYTNELNNQHPNAEKLTLYKKEFITIGGLQNDAEGNLKREGLIFRIKEYGAIAKSLSEGSFVFIN